MAYQRFPYTLQSSGHPFAQTPLRVLFMRQSIQSQRLLRYATLETVLMLLPYATSALARFLPVARNGIFTMAPALFVDGGSNSFWLVGGEL